MQPRIVSVIIGLAALGLAAPAHAIPFELLHQGRLFDSASGLPLDGPHDISLAIMSAPAGGTSLHAEVVQVQVENGYYALTLGLESGNPLDTSVFESPTWLSIAVDSGPPLPRQAIRSVPYAFVANVAENVSGGIVDATEIRVNGTTVIDGSGVFTGTDTLSGLSCASGQLALFDGTTWICGDDKVRSDSEIVAAVEAGPIALASGSTAGGKQISVLDLPEVQAFIEATGMNFEASSTLGGQSISLGDHLSFSEIDAHLTTGVELGATSTMGGVELATLDDVDSALAGVAQEAKQDEILADLEAINKVCASRPQYSRSCNDFSSQGWASETECLTDGRWHLYATWVSGGISEHVSGGRAKFYSAAQSGADTKMRIGREWYEVSVRTNDSATGFWVFNKEKAKHMSWHMRSNGVIDNFHMSTNDGGWHNNWFNGDLGNWHYMQYNYSHLGSFNTSQNGGVGVWAKY